LYVIEYFNMNTCGPVKNILDTCVKYNLQYFVIHAIENADYCSMSQWKRLVKVTIEDRFKRQLSVTKPLYKSLLYIRNTSCYMSPWWYIAHMFPTKSKQSRLIIQLMLNRYRHIHTFCHYCDVQVNINIHHILFDCSYFSQLRQALWCYVEEAGPPILVQHLNNMSAVEKCSFILSGFNTNYIVEWKDLYLSLSDYIYIMMKSYENNM